jgi:spermidine/putrescine transport system substrate-binding protein
MRNGNRVIRWLVILAAMIWAGAVYANELVILNWADYLDPEVVAEFEKENGAKVRFVYFESDEGRDNYLVEQGIAGIDVALVDNTAVKPYAKRGWLKPLRKEDIPNLRHIDPKWAEYYKGLSEYGAAYSWGTLGIVYRRDLVKPAPASWLDLLRPSEAARGRILMIDDSVELIAVALKALGYSMNESSEQALKEAKALLLDQRPAVREYGYFAVDKSSSLISGDTVMGMAYNGDALILADLDERIGFLVPKEGSSLWVDYLVIMSKAPHPELAMRFIDFINRPQVAARNAQYTYSATANSAAEKLLPEEFLGDPLVYPPPEVMARCEAYAEQSPAVRRRINMIYADVTR